MFLGATKKAIPSWYGGSVLNVAS
uniref:Uncharacterized protein n=1 Tax=Oryza sativa subsp. japonica TaxID=39947 RepID=Q2R112_ORYSJ|nr:hypothetical protein LOC_Os11g40709 [Oryza sativa Japonica Group]